jgi:hypothetical protein
MYRLFPLALLACGGSSSTLPSTDGELTIVHTAHMEGEIEPCG